MGYGLNTSMLKRKQKKFPLSHGKSVFSVKMPLHVFIIELCDIFFTDNFNTLPEEIVLKIFRMTDKRTLIKCAFVCQQWRRIAYDESLWQHLNIPSRRMSILTLHNLLARNIKYFSASHSNVSYPF